MIRSTVLFGFLICLAASRFILFETPSSDEFISKLETNNLYDSYDDSGIEPNLEWGYKKLYLGKRQRGEYVKH